MLTNNRFIIKIEKYYIKMKYYKYYKFILFYK